MSAARQLDLWPGPQLALVFNPAEGSPELDALDEAEAAEEAACDYADAQIAAALPPFRLPLDDGRELFFRPQFGDCFVQKQGGSYGELVRLPLLVSLEKDRATLRTIDRRKPDRDVRTWLTLDDAQTIIEGWPFFVSVGYQRGVEKLPRHAALIELARGTTAKQRWLDASKVGMGGEKGRRSLWLYSALSDLAHERAAGRLTRPAYLKACALVRDRVTWI